MYSTFYMNLNIKISLLVCAFLLASNTANAATFPQLAMLEETSSSTQSSTKKKAPKLRGSSCLRSVETVKRKASKINDVIVRSAKKYSIDSNLIRAVIAVESCYNSKAVSPAGAQGLMQLIPATAERFGVSDSFDVQQNINAGTKYLRFLVDRFNGDLEKVTAGYNAGEGRVDRYKGIPPFKETQKYVKNVLRIYKALSYRKPTATTRSNKGLKNAVVSRRVQKPQPSKVRAIYKPRALTAKPGRQGWEYNRLRAPQLYKKR